MGCEKFVSAHIRKTQQRSSTRARPIFITANFVTRLLFVTAPNASRAASKAAGDRVTHHRCPSAQVADPQDDSIFHPRTWHRAARLGWVSFHRLQRGLRGWSWMRPFPRTLRTVATATLQAARPCGVVPFRLRIPTPNGAKWHGQTVRRMIDRAAC